MRRLVLKPVSLNLPLVYTYTVSIRLEEQTTHNIQALHTVLNEKMSGEKSNLLGKLVFLACFVYACYNGAAFPKYQTIQLIVLEVAVLLFCEFGPISTFLARKMCHSFR